MIASTRRAPAYASALAQVSADKRVDILRLVRHSGSISQAAREAGVSYKAAWQAIDTLTNLAGVVLVARVVGGAGGGGARLTPAGRQLLAAAEDLEQARREVLARWQQRLPRQPRLPQDGAAADAQAPGAAALPPVLSRLSLRTSMRNQFPCTVRGLDGAGQVVRVRLCLADGAPLHSRITRESAELLGLAEGLPVLALCKATAVSVQRWRAAGGGAAAFAGGACNRLAGRVTRVARGDGGDGGDEVVAALAAGVQLVGFGPPAGGLRAGSRVTLLVEESAVVVALPG